MKLVDGCYIKYFRTDSRVLYNTKTVWVSTAPLFGLWAEIDMLRRILRHASPLSEEYYQPETLIWSKVAVDEAGDVCDANQ